MTTGNISGTSTAQGTDGILQKVKELGFDSFDALLEERERLAKERDNFKTQHENAEKLISKQGGELGELRKKEKELSDQLKAGGKTDDGSGATGTVKPTTSEEDQVKQLEASLTDEQKKAADEAFQKLADADKVLVAGNTKYRKQFLERARQAVATVPKSIFSQTPATTTEASGDEIEKRITSLWDTQKKVSRYSPPGPSNGGGMGGSQQAPKKTPHLGGGVLGAIAQMKTG